ncbi:dynamin family protein [Weeksellaceae bacterium TAE3-ERU29]|nr:dynamin family protein [Weeksellaceae bacterium TAE3-ERU29]
MNQNIIIIGAIIIIGLLIAVIYLLLNKSKKQEIVEEGKSLPSSNLKIKIEELSKTKNELAEEANKLKKQVNELKSQLKKSADQTEDSLTQRISADTDDYKNQLVQLEKKLEDVTEELEDAEDKVADYKKRWEREKKKLEEVSVSLEDTEGKLKKIEKELEDSLSNVREKKLALSKKEEAIDFINKILAAESANDDESTKELYQKVENIQSFIEEEVCEFFRQNKILKKEEIEQIKAEVWEWANLQKKSWLKNKKIVAFVGEFSAGKTSIVNRILSQDDDTVIKLPVSSKATTAIATYISYGGEFNSQFTDSTGKLKRISKFIFEKINKEILSEVNISSLIQYFVMSYNNKNLENLSILDTPGFSSNDKEDTMRTSEVIKEADMLFWVFDANAGEINQASLQTIRENLQEVPLFIVINKSDTKSIGELDKLEAHIKETIQKNNIEVKGYIRFSQKEPIKKLMEAIQSVPLNKGRNDFIREPYKLIESELEQLKLEGYEQKEISREYLKSIRDNEEVFEEATREIEDICADLTSIGEEKTSWFGWGEKVHKMSESEKHIYDVKLNRIKQNRNRVTEAHENILYYKKEIEKIDKVKDEIKDKYRILDINKDIFEKYLKEWDKKYFEDNIIKDIKELTN